ncbi:unnamed protein product, partial [Staurois parvus]
MSVRPCCVCMYMCLCSAPAVEYRCEPMHAQAEHAKSM